MNCSYLIRKTIVLFFLKKDEALLLLDFWGIPENSKNCVVRALDGYLKVTKQQRIYEAYSQLLLKTLNLHNPVVKTEIVDLVKATSSNAGTNTSKFTAYSTKPASIFKAGLSGLPVQEILKWGICSKDSSWQNHYHSFVIGNQISYQSNVGIGSAFNLRRRVARGQHIC